MPRWPRPNEVASTTFGGLSRSELMSRVRSTGNRTTEVRLKTLLRQEGLGGWRRHLSLPGKPDFTWPRLRVALFVDGCFWHGHDCGKNISPKTNPEEWRIKISRNKKRDQRVNRDLRNMGWSVIRIWECQLRRPKNCITRIKRILGKGID
jgi:DNA mismatch endonuclease (patch repair protein)